LAVDYYFIPLKILLNLCNVNELNFKGWDDVIAVDFTRTAHSVQRTGADLQKWAKQQETKVDLSALFQPRQPAMTHEEATHLSEEWNEDLEKMEAFVLEGKKFIKLPEEERGICHSADSYVYLCRYWVPADDLEEQENEDFEADEDYQCVVVYFWQVLYIVAILVAY
jgi:hypothetical protein